MKRSNGSGFTLIELLIVIAIFGIVAAIAIPQFAAYRNGTPGTLSEQPTGYGPVKVR